MSHRSTRRPQWWGRTGAPVPPSPPSSGLPTRYLSRTPEDPSWLAALWSLRGAELMPLTPPLEAFAGQSARGYCKQHQQNVARHPRPEKAGSDFLSPDLITALRTRDPRSRTAPATLSIVPQARPVTSPPAKYRSCHPFLWPSSRTIRPFAPTLGLQITPVRRQKWPVPVCRVSRNASPLRTPANRSPPLPTAPVSTSRVLGRRTLPLQYPTPLTLLLHLSTRPVTPFDVSVLGLESTTSRYE